MRKRVMPLIFAVALIMGMVVNVDVARAESMDYTDEPIIFGTEYEGHVEKAGREHADTYLIDIPVDGKVTFTGYAQVDSGSSSLSVNWFTVNLYKGKSKADLTYHQFNKNDESSFTDDIKGGKYTMYVGESGSSNIDYHLIIDFKPTIPSTAKVSSPAKGSLKVSMPKGTGVSAYEIQYRGAGDWITKEVKSTKNLNTTIKGLKSGKYSIHVRKVVTDSYGYTYYSDWTKTQSVIIK